MDELDYYLMNCFPDNYWSGREDCNLLLWGINGTEPKLCSIAYGIEYDPYQGHDDGEERGTENNLEIKSILNERYRTDQAFHRLIKYGEEISKKCSIPFSVIVYPALRNDFENKWEETENKYKREKVVFYWHELYKAGIKLSGKELRERLYSIMGIAYTDKGTGKDENSHLSDYFHFWSRESLSKKITKLNIDGIIVNNSLNKAIIVEIKRSSKPHIPWWRPHAKDKPDYELELAYSKQIEAKFWLLHHESRPCHRNEIITFYDIKDIDANKTKDYIIPIEVKIKCRMSGEDSLESRIERFINSMRIDNGENEV